MNLSRQTIKDVLKIALPAVGEMILYMMIGVFDTMMVGRYGGNVSVSSVGLCTEIIYTFSNMFIAVGISIGITSLVARRVGAGELELAEEYGTLGFGVAVLLSFIISFLLFVFNTNILSFAGANNEVISLGAPYMRIASIGIFFNMMMSSLNGCLRGYGNTKTPLFASLLVNLINIPLDYILIFGKFGAPELGVRGAAIATSIAQFSGFVFIVLYMIFKSKIKIRFKYISMFKSHMLSDLLRLSIPSSLQEGALSISRLLCNFMIVSLGTVSFAANQITTSIESISFMPGWGFAVAATALVGHKVGEKDFKKAKEYAFTATILGSGVMLFCSILFLTIPSQLINLFVHGGEKEVIRLGTFCLMVAAIEQPLMGVSMILGGALKGGGDTKTPFTISVISSWFFRLPIMLYFIYILKLSVVYVWVITAIQWSFDGLLTWYLYKKKFTRENIIGKQR